MGDSGAATPLPAGWREFATGDGRCYFHNATTNETTWTRPTPAASPASPSRASATTASTPPATPSIGTASSPMSVENSRGMKAGLSSSVPSATIVSTTVQSAYSLSNLVTRTGLGGGDNSKMDNGYFELPRERLLEINLRPPHSWAWIKHGAMVARRGQVKFTRQGLREQGFGKYMKKALTGEGTRLVKAEGNGRVLCADGGKIVSVVELQGERLCINGNDLLALSGSLSYDVTFTKGAGLLAGGLFSVKVWGQGILAFTCHGDVVTMRATPQDPIYTDPNATVLWTHDPKLKTDINMKALIGKGSGEEFQLCFTEGFVVIQPYEEVVGQHYADGG